MGDHVLFCWLGMTDLRAAAGEAEAGLGPVAQAVTDRPFKEVVLLNNWEKVKEENCTASVPFDISADFIPDLLRKHDQTLERLAAGLPATAPEFGDIIYRSEVMQRVILKARRIAPRSIPVLIEGESGTGKELFARAIHDASPRKDKPFVAINCGAIPAELVESELFGHEKGAFTGASNARQNTLTRAAVWSMDEELDVEDIREAMLPVAATDKQSETILNQPLAPAIDLPAIMKTVAVHYLERGLAAAHGNKTKAAQILGLPSYQTLTNWLRKYGLE